MELSRPMALTNYLQLLPIPDMELTKCWWTEQIILPQFQPEVKNEVDIPGETSGNLYLANEADDMAVVLTQLGFEVTLLKNNDLRNLKTNLDKCTPILKGTIWLYSILQVMGWKSTAEIISE